MGANADLSQQTHRVELVVAGERLQLRADHSLFWPGGDTLFVADTHFGKAGVFRRQGLGVPAGTTEADLRRLTRALEETAASCLVVLGDFLHAPPTGDSRWLARFAEWRAGHSALSIAVTRGNHDRVARLPADCAIEWQVGSRLCGPFVAQHAPGVDARGPVLCGHLHPVVHLRAGSERLRSPAFWLGPDGLVLPAFCSFAGGMPIAPARGDRVFVIGVGQIAEACLDASRSEAAHHSPANGRGR